MIDNMSDNMNGTMNDTLINTLIDPNVEQKFRAKIKELMGYVLAHLRVPKFNSRPWISNINTKKASQAWLIKIDVLREIENLSSKHPTLIENTDRYMDEEFENAVKLAMDLSGLDRSIFPTNPRIVKMVMNINFQLICLAREPLLQPMDLSGLDRSQIIPGI